MNKTFYLYFTTSGVYHDSYLLWAKDLLYTYQNKIQYQFTDADYIAAAVNV